MRERWGISISHHRDERGSGSRSTLAGEPGRHGSLSVMWGRTHADTVDGKRYNDACGCPVDVGGGGRLLFGRGYELERPGGWIRLRRHGSRQFATCVFLGLRKHEIT